MASLRARLIISSFWVLLACGLALVVVLPRLSQQVLTAELERSLDQQTKVTVALTRALLRRSGERDLLPEVRRLGQAIHARITLIRLDGKVVADSESDPVRMENHANRPEVRAALRRPFGESRRYSATQGVDRLYVASSVAQDGRVWGVARLSLPLAAVWARTSQLRNGLIAAVLAALALAALVSLRVADSVSRPVRELSEMAQRLAAGDLQSRAKTRSEDELGSLARSFNRMADQVEQLLARHAAAEATLRTVFDRMGDGILLTDQDARVVLANRTARRLLGLAGEVPVGRTVLELSLQRALADLVERVLADGQERSLEVELRDGPPRAVAVSASRTDRPGSQGQGALLVLRDVTEARRLEQLRRDFVANASHELRTPLASLRVMLESLLGGAWEEPETAQRFLSVALRETTRLEALAEDLLALARVEGQPPGVELVPVPVGRIFEQVEAALAPMAAARQQALIFEDPGGLAVAAEPEGLRQALANLVDNAIKYTPPQGHIRVSARDQGSDVTLAVEDTGEGIPEALLPRLFERFFRVDKARSRQVGGTGLGLAIVRHLIVGMGGQVRVQSQVGRGSRFELVLRRADPEPRAEDAGPS